MVEGFSEGSAGLRALMLSYRSRDIQTYIHKYMSIYIYTRNIEAYGGLSAVTKRGLLHSKP